MTGPTDATITLRDAASVRTEARRTALDEAIADLEAEIDRRVPEADPGSKVQSYADGWYDAVDRLRTLRDTPPPRSDRDE